MKNRIKSQLLIVICSLSFGIPGSLFAASKEEAEVNPVPVRSLLIFLDDTEPYYFDASNPIRNYYFRAITSSSSIALLQKAGPILVSGSVLYNLFKDRSKQGQDYDKGKFQAFWQNFDIDDWVVKKIVNSAIPADEVDKKDTPFFLMIHKDDRLLSHHSDQLNVVEKNNLKITELEYLVGLKINHFEPVKVKNNEEFRQYLAQIYEPKEKYWQSFAQSFAQYTGSNFVNLLKTIFVTNKEYGLEHKEKNPYWVIYLNGHGGLNQVIASIYLAQFPELLDFCQTSIKTRLLMYASCYAAGFNAKKVYGELTAAAKKNNTYSFAIITSALTDAPTYSAPASVKANRLVSQNNYYQFIQETTQHEIIDYAKAAKSIMFLKEGTEAWISNIPQIRLPGLAWFSVLEEQKTMVSIGSVLVQGRGDAPLDIQKYFKFDHPRALLFYTRYVPFQLIIDTIDFPALIPMAESDYKESINIGSYYYIDSILAQEFGTQAVIATFKQVKLSSTTFIIGLIDCVDGRLENFYINYPLKFEDKPSISYTKTTSGAKGREVITEGPAIADVEGKIKQVTEEIGKQFKIGESKVAPVKEVIKKRLK